MTSETTQETSNTTKANKQPQQQQQQQRRSFAPINEGEWNEIQTAVTRSPGLGRILLSVVRNRGARVVVTETPIGEELLTHTSELDRILARMGRRLTRNLNVVDMQKKSNFEMEAARFIQPLRELTARMAIQFDDGENGIVRHQGTKQLMREMKAAEKKAKDVESGETTPGAA